MRHISFGRRLPEFISTVLFGDRERFGIVPKEDDPSWIEWSNTGVAGHDKTMRGPIAGTICDWGYRIMNKLDMTGKRVLEIGPGNIAHIKHWKGQPDLYHIADRRAEMLDVSEKKLTGAGVRVEKTLLCPDNPLAAAFERSSFDIIVSFYSLEHLYPLEDYLIPLVDILKPGGILIGGIPAEGGLAWGLGRFSFTRRYFMKHTTINWDKIICWEHPNFADQILNALEQRMDKVLLCYDPFKIPLIDVNLIISFIFRKRPEKY